MKATRRDGPVHGTYHFLDVGDQKYGECTLVVFGDVRILIDGGHIKDFEGQEGHPSIPEQLATILGGDPPFGITLLVVTHCHEDHVGCLPELVGEDVIAPKWALITHPKLGFGRSDQDADSVADLADGKTRALAAALREEDASDLSDEELADFIDAVAKVEDRYAELIQLLQERKVKVIPYVGAALPQALAKQLAPANATLIGPSEEQLLRCAEQIAKSNKDAADAVADILASDATLDDVTIYRRVVSVEADFTGGRGDGMNCQSITFAFGPPGERVLLAGDMQFAEPGVKGAVELVAALREAAAAEGPYVLFKTTHHTSHNGLDKDLLEEFGAPPILVHSGGRNDTTHPNPSVLRALKSLSRDIIFARTDRNGAIDVQPHLRPDEAISVSKGRLNDFTTNARDEVEFGQPITPSQQPVAPIVPVSGPQIIIVTLLPGPIDLTVAGVDIQVRSSSAGHADRVSHTQVSTRTDFRLAGDRKLPRLLFVTNRERLEANIGKAESETVVSQIQRRHALIDVAGSYDQVLRTVRSALAAEDMKGIVIVGGYDVVPAGVIDVLSDHLRRELGGDADEELDQFIVWSDEEYGDVDGDRIAELPVSRVADGRDAATFLAAMQAGSPTRFERFGVRNVERPFADGVWGGISGSRPLNVSEKFLSKQVDPAHLDSSSHYFMLHGRHDDGTVFTGESRGGGNPIAFEIGSVPKTFSGLVFSGCCWGALTVEQRACDIGTAPVTPRAPERSIAVSYLKAGANCFIGSTGAHYSGPDTDPDENLAYPLHEAFYKTLFAGSSLQGAAALFRARSDFSRYIAQGKGAWEPIDYARRLKNRAQFTCLGLGW